MRISVEGGTVKDHGEELCRSCRYLSTRQHRSGREVMQCGMFSKPHNVVREPVYSCNQYESKNTPTFREMKEMAWVLTPGREHLGFRRVTKMDQEEKERLKDL